MDNSKYITLYCTGCGLCQSANKTELKDIEGGFPNAQIKETDDIDFFKAVCPVFYYDGEAAHDVWGNVDKAYVGYSSDKDIRFKAASGGALTEICIYLLESKQVDGIIHTTCDPKDQTKNISVISTTADEVKARSGSRYSISVPLKDILNMVESDKKYAFVGKPCDVMALRRYFAINKDLEKNISVLLSFFCAGEPSAIAQDNLLKKMNCEHDECESITYRGNGWPGYTTVVKKDGTVKKLEYKIAWGQYLGRDIRTICRFCLDGTGDAADIVCADFWYLDGDGKPDFSEHDGRNIIITRNEKGTKIMEGVIENSGIIDEEDFTESMDDEFLKYQPAQYKRKGTMKTAISAMRLCGKTFPRYSRSYLNKYASHIKTKDKIDYFIGTIKRIIKGRI